MMSDSRKQQGFTTVELLVTLFVGALFILSGYQLYRAINARSGDARMMAEASSIGYEVLRSEGVYESASRACSSTLTHQSRAISRTSSTLSNLSIQMFRCQPFSDSSVVRLTVVVKYGAPQKEVSHATYVSL